VVRGRPYRIRLVYDTATVRPGAVVAARSLLADAGALLHDSYRVHFSVGGRRWEARFAEDGLEHEARIFFDGRDADGWTLESGSHPYAVEVITEVTGDVYYRTDVFGEPAGGVPTTVTLREAQPFVRRVVGRLAVHNLVYSPLGAGWAVDEVDKLYFDPDGSILLAQGGRGNVTLTPTLAAWPQPLWEDPVLRPAAVEIDAAGNLYVGMAASGAILRIAPDGTREVFATVVGGLADLHLDAARETPYATSPTRRNLFRVTPEGLEEVILARDTARLGSLAGFDIDADGTIYVVDRLTRKVYRIDTGGRLTDLYDLGLLESVDPEDLALDGAGGMYVADRLGQRVVHFDAAGASETVYRSRLDADEAVELFKEYLSGGVDDVVNEALAGCSSEYSLRSRSRSRSRHLPLVSRCRTATSAARRA
jgi:hypothetical protein